MKNAMHFCPQYQAPGECDAPGCVVRSCWGGSGGRDGKGLGLLVAESKVLYIKFPFILELGAHPSAGKGDKSQQSQMSYAAH